MCVIKYYIFVYNILHSIRWNIYKRYGLDVSIKYC